MPNIPLARLHERLEIGARRAHLQTLQVRLDATAAITRGIQPQPHTARNHTASDAILRARRTIWHGVHELRLQHVVIFGDRHRVYQQIHFGHAGEPRMRSSNVRIKLSRAHGTPAHLGVDARRSTDRHLLSARSNPPALARAPAAAGST